MMSATYTVGFLAEVIGAEVRGDPTQKIDGVAPLTSHLPYKIGFYLSTQYRTELQNTTLSAVILAEKHLQDCSVTALITVDPSLGFAKISQLLNPTPIGIPEIHATAVIHQEAKIASNVTIGPYVVIEAGVTVHEGAVIGAYTYLGKNVTLGTETRLWPHVTLYPGVQIGKYCTIHSGAVIGKDGFGFAREKEKWIKIPQIGSVNLGNSVEVGANTTIDRGTLEDTQIGNGVILDNQIQLGHNIQIGDHTAIAGCVGIAGSTHIGKRCMIGGGSKINGHIEITDDVVLLANSQVGHSIRERGIYSSHLMIQPAHEWKRTLFRFLNINAMNKRLSTLEKSLKDYECT